jgi:asparagine synthetase B (glutamine-hydrolysing)
MENDKLIDAISSIDDYLSRMEVDSELIRSAYIPAISDFLKEINRTFIFFIAAYEKNSGISKNEIDSIYKMIKSLKEKM